MSTAKKRTNLQKTVNLVTLAMLTAIIFVMTFTPIGYLKAGPLELTLIMVPVIIGAVTQGPAAGALLGGVFGLSSFIQCFTGSVLGAVLVSVNIPLTILVCFAPRILAGWLCGVIFKACAKKLKKDGWSYVIASLCGSALNTILFLSFLAICFWSTEFAGGPIIKTVIAIAAGINAPVELIVCAVLGSAIGKGLTVALKRVK